MPVPPIPMRCTFTIAADRTGQPSSGKALRGQKIGYAWIGEMEGPRHERRRHFRGKARPGRILHVRFRAPAQTSWIAAETRNIGVGGAFIASSELLPVGTTLTVEVTLPTSEQRFTLPAVVRWTSDAKGGMGVQFVGVDVDVLLELNDYFSTLTGA
jgi:hypothetical protein